MAWIIAIVRNKRIKVDIDLGNDTIYDLIKKIKKKEPYLCGELRVVFDGMAYQTDFFDVKIKNIGIEEGDHLFIEEEEHEGGGGTEIIIEYKNKKVIKVIVDVNRDTVNDLISKAKKIEPDLKFSLLVIEGQEVANKDFSKPLRDFELEDGDRIVITEYYNG